MHKTAIVFAAATLIVFSSAFANEPPQSTPKAQEIFDAIRADNLTLLTRLVRTPAAANAENALHWRPLHYAALYGSTRSISFLLKAGADPNALNQPGDTPLVYAAWNLERTRLLMEAGANVNAKTKKQVSPLLVASAVESNSRTVQYLLSKGADPNGKDAFENTSLQHAAGLGDAHSMAALLQKGADPKAANKVSGNGMLNAAASGQRTPVEMMARAGVDPNAANQFSGRVKNGPIALYPLTSLMLAAPYAEPATIDILLKVGARANAADIRKMTPLMLSIATDQANPVNVHKLIDAGADVNAKDQNGESVLDWARKFNNPEVVALLEQAHATGSAPKTLSAVPTGTQVSTAHEAIARSLPLLAKSDPAFFREGGGCAGCHHQPAYARAYAALAQASAPNNEELRRSFIDAMRASSIRDQSQLPYMDSPGGGFDPALFNLMSFAELKEPASPYTDLLIHYVAVQQAPDGSWQAYGIARPPIEDSSIVRTSLAIRALRAYGWAARRSEFEARVDHARKWLEASKPKTSYEEAERIAGLLAAGVPAAKLTHDADHLIELQRTDGGWSQTPYLASDAYATGLVMHTLRTAGFLTLTDQRYQRGARFLLNTQFPDGSWYVRSRAPKFQPYFQSGFPFDHDQWISSIGTAYAVMALAPLDKSTNLQASLQ